MNAQQNKMSADQERAALNAEEAEELERLSEEYATAASKLRKTLRMSNPPEPGQVQLFLDAESHVASIVRRLKELIASPITDDR